MSENNLIHKVTLLKLKVANLKKAKVLQKTAAAESCIEEAVYILEQMAEELQRTQGILEDFITNEMGLGVTVNGE